MTTGGRAECEGSPAPTKLGLPNGLDQVREILFGAHNRDLARRLARTEAHITTQADELRCEMRQRMDVLDAHLRRENDALRASLESQRSTVVDAQSAAAREAREAFALLDQRVRRLEDAMTRAQHEFRQQLLEQANSFIDEVRRVRADMMVALDREVAAVWNEAAEGPASGAAPTSEESHERPGAASDERPEAA
jgi:hypothetical protein